MAHKNENLGRRPIDFHNRVVKEALPEYFTDDNLTLVNFLEDYYNFLDSDTVHSFDTEIKDLNNLRDITETPSEYLNQIIYELGSKLENGNLFTDARFTARRFAEHYRQKGSRKAIEEFFRAFFQQDVEVEYPKKDIFTVGEDKIGFDSQKFIQNYARYQIFSILIKVGLGVPTYRELYKKFAHPAGFYFEGIVAVEGEADLGFNSMPISVADSAQTTIISQATNVITSASSYTSLLDSGGTNVRADLNQLVSLYQTFTPAQLGGFYTSIKELIDPNSFTFDDSAAVSPTMDLTTETMDNNMFTRYTSDSSF